MGKRCTDAYGRGHEGITQLCARYLANCRWFFFPLGREQKKGAKAGGVPVGPVQLSGAFGGTGIVATSGHGGNRKPFTHGKCASRKCRPVDQGLRRSIPPLELFSEWGLPQLILPKVWRGHLHRVTHSACFFPKGSGWAWRKKGEFLFGGAGGFSAGNTPPTFEQVTA